MRRLLLTLLLLLTVVPAAVAAEPFPGTTWTEEYFETADGVRLHADVLRPTAAGDAKTPVLLTVSPYTNHAAATAADFDPTQSGPSNRFYDFLEAGRVIDRGYTYVMVDLRGFGGSAGCNDWGGPGEQEDVRAAVEWAASQEWSTGKVGLIGKSYDGWTGLMAIAQQPKGLAAVLSMEPVYSGYRYLYTDGVRFTNSAATPTSFTLTDATPGSLSDTPDYLLNGAPLDPSCYALNVAEQQQDDPESDFWKARDLIPEAAGRTTPLFLTQGYLETNTRPDGAFAFYNAMAGPKRAWFGQFDHVRGYEQDSTGTFLTGRGGFAEEAMRFLDHHVAGTAPAPADPAVAVQDFQGRYRAEAAWPPADTVARSTSLKVGEYTDDGANAGTGAGGGLGIWTFSQPLPHAMWLTGEPVFEAEIGDASPRSNLVANVYDVAPDGMATMISRGAKLLRSGGKARIEMYGQDWQLDAGHRIGVLISSANSEWWVHVPTGAPVTVDSASISLPLLTHERTAFLDGGRTIRLDEYAMDAPFQVAEDVIAAAETRFDLPGPLTAAPTPGVVPAPATPAADKLTARVRRRGKRVFVRGQAPAGSRVTVRVLRRKRGVARRVVALPTGVRRYAVRVLVRKTRRLRVRVAAKTPAGTTLRVRRRVR